MTEARCENCGGTGRQAELRTMFTADGYRWRRCGICGGSGKSTFKPEAHVKRWQANARGEHQPSPARQDGGK